MNAKLQKADFLPVEAHDLAMQGFFGIMSRWDADNKVMRAVLGSPAERTFFDWKKGRVARLPNDTLRRIGYVAGIWKALQIVYSDPQLADSWVNRPNRAFGGQTPLARMAAGDVTDLAAVRDYIDAARSPWS
ncbi:MbcA/ParS/Xre antitoxin family protein [Pseudolabrys sp. FHR47]|uniref:MbcA/ParS/Xre antitoxin family protein n=1 Tax=Pseudolabrys sp. FHR47 TaxID=2562284 RepID=UPI0010BF626C|nr:MbcA/ParS/Xre antitoxin family protein [Pseudolabrys sp. FHR47]